MVLCAGGVYKYFNVVKRTAENETIRHEEVYVYVLLVFYMYPVRAVSNIRGFSIGVKHSALVKQYYCIEGKPEGVSEKECEQRRKAWQHIDLYFFRKIIHWTNNEELKPGRYVYIPGNHVYGRIKEVLNLIGKPVEQLRPYGIFFPEKHLSYHTQSMIKNGKQRVINYELIPADTHGHLLSNTSLKQFLQKTLGNKTITTTLHGYKLTIGNGTLPLFIGGWRRWFGLTEINYNNEKQVQIKL